MKKLLLSAAVLAAFSASVFGQVVCTPGTDFDNNYAIDDFANPLEMQYNDLYWWADKDSVLTIDSLSEDETPVCLNPERHFKYTFERYDAIDGGYMDLTISQPYGKYEPVGVGFGAGKYLDLSTGNAQVVFVVENLSSTNLQLRVALQDTAGKLVNAIGKAKDTEVYNDEIAYTLPRYAVTGPNANKYKITDTLDYSRPNAYQAKYNYVGCKRGVAAGKDSSFNYKAVEGVAFTFVSASTISTDGYKPLNIEDVKVRFRYFAVGTRCNLKPLAVENDVVYSKAKLNVYPNPSKGGNITLATTAKNVRVMDALGNVVFTAASANEINVDNFTKGLYLLQSSNGTARFIVE